MCEKIRHAYSTLLVNVSKLTGDCNTQILLKWFSVTALLQEKEKTSAFYNALKAQRYFSVPVREAGRPKKPKPTKQEKQRRFLSLALLAMLFMDVLTATTLQCVIMPRAFPASLMELLKENVS